MPRSKAWRRITDFLRSQGALSAIQLGHAGRKVATKRAVGGIRAAQTKSDAKHGEPPWQRHRAKPDGVQAGALVPREMDRDDIRAGDRQSCRSRQRAVDRCRLRHLRNAWRARLHHPAIPVADHQQAAGQLMAATCKAGCGLRWN
jgi:hypothetical protein